MTTTTPPFRRVMSNAIATAIHELDRSQVDDQDAAPEVPGQAPAIRPRLHELDGHLHCSIVGTCLSTAELRKVMARFMEVGGASDLAIHHEAVRRVSQDLAVAKALSKVLDRRHESTVQRFRRAHDTAALEVLWQDALQQGDIPGAYWATLTSRVATAELRQRAFGDVHMLSHLIGAANRADIRRLVAIEADNQELRDKLERQQARFAQIVDGRDRAITQLQQQAADAAVEARRQEAEQRGEDTEQWRRDRARDVAAAVALQTARREHAEREAHQLADELQRARGELDRLRRSARELSEELGAAESQLRELSDPQGAVDSAVRQYVFGRRILYVGGRPSSTPAIRELVRRYGGEFRKHDGGIEDRKGLLGASVAWSELVFFPVDCIDHDSANALKRLCVQSAIRFVPLRTASVASFASALATLAADRPADEPPGFHICRKHG